MKLQDGVYWYREKGFLDANTYVIKDERTVLIDPGLENYLGLLAKELQDDGLSPKEIDVIAITHLHPDHCDAVAALKAVSGAEVAVHSSQRYYLDVLLEEVSRFLDIGVGAKKIDVDLVFDDKLHMGNAELKVFHTPGHSPESICFYRSDNKILISGDLVFEQAIGRADLPFGNNEELANSFNTVSALDTELLLPGHGAILKGRDTIRRNYELIRAFYFSWL